MNVFGLTQFGRKMARGGMLMGWVAIMALACGKADAQVDQKLEASPPAPSRVEPAMEAGAPREKQENVTAQQSYDEEAFQLTFEAPETVKAGSPLTLKVVLVAKNGYKVNDEYPIKFKVDQNSGVTSDKETIRKEDSKVEKMRVEMPVQITVGKAGAASVSGRLSFSVCTDERCLIEKRDLQLNVTAS